MSYKSQYRKSLYKRRLAKGLCGSCGAHPHVSDKTQCQICTDRRYWSYRRDRTTGVRDRALIFPNPNAHKAASKTYREKNMELCRERTRTCQRRKREAVIKAYGGKCQCCGETTFEFLTFDHKNNNGNEHRKQGLTGYKFCLWLEAHNYPDDIQVLCYNCNCAQYRYQICPHQRRLNVRTA